MHFADFISLMASHYVGEVEMFRQVVVQPADTRVAEVTERAKSNPAYGDWANDDLGELGQILELTSHLAVIALHRVVETQRSAILQHGVDADQVRDLHRVEDARAFAKKGGIDIDDVHRAGSIEELRVLSNAVKHGGNVTAELAEFDGWSEGARLDDLMEAFE